METPRGYLGFSIGSGMEPRRGKTCFAETAEVGRGDRSSALPPLLREELRGLRRSGLASADAQADGVGEIAVLSGAGRGDSGTFHKLASSGRSSSESFISSSNSLMDFRLGCQEPLLPGPFPSIGDIPRCCVEMGFGIGRGCVGLRRGCEGDGDRDRVRLLIAVMANVGLEGLRDPLLVPLLFGKLRDCAGPLPRASLICPCKDGYDSLFPPFVSSRVGAVNVVGLLLQLMVKFPSLGFGTL